MKSKIEIYDYINNHKMSFLGKSSNKYKEYSKIQKFNEWNIDTKIVLEIVPTSMSHLYDYLLDNKGKYCVCGHENSFKSFSTGYSNFCSKKCLYNWRSVTMSGLNNNANKMTPERKLIANEKQSKTMKRLISEGKFTPCVTNSWARSRCIVDINQNGIDKQIKCRSSWDAFFQIKNPKFLYEKIRIPYEFNGNFHNYIVDFVDVGSRIIYEVKPKGEKETPRNKAKFEFAKNWCKVNNYRFEIIDDDWFKLNYDEHLLIGHTDEEKLNRLLKQFI